MGPIREVAERLRAQFPLQNRRALSRAQPKPWARLHFEGTTGLFPSRPLSPTAHACRLAENQRVLLGIPALGGNSGPAPSLCMTQVGGLVVVSSKPAKP